ncbi:hypothetical protein H9P43_002999 [Blastocladiella emersonii ATCC 22665]|nr:hypothetical protein H9P43_002999 [Blastocladiella emersonii ATCC 22665]
MPPKRNMGKPKTAPPKALVEAAKAKAEAKTAAAAAATSASASAASSSNGAAKPTSAASASLAKTAAALKAARAAAAAGGAKSASAAAQQRKPLPAKEATIFKTVLKMYETKQYKKGLKAVEGILKKVPDHGESHAMKGLFMSQLDQREEGFKEVRKAVELDPGSHIIWHVYGLIHRGGKEYAEAIKCYHEALKLDSHNVQILRDLALLQIQTRDYAGYKATRELLARMFRGVHQRPHLVGLVVANHLLKDYDTALAMIEAWQGTYNPAPPPRDWDWSEMLMYKNEILEEAGELDRALDELDAMERVVCDVRAVQERRAHLLVTLGHHERAMEAYAKLIKTNPDSRNYVDGFIRAAQEAPVDVLEGLAEEYPKSGLIQLMLLIEADAKSDLFAARLEQYIVANVAKGVPSLFANLRPLYDDADKAPVLESVAQRLLETANADADAATGAEGKLWLHYFLAQYYDRQGERAVALEHVRQAVAEQDAERPVPELLMLEGRIYKHAGDAQRARDTLEAARKVDLKDRYLNTKCTKYLIRNGEIEQAEATIRLFARPDIANPIADLVDMQCQWFAFECGHAHAAAGRHGPALKKFEQLVGHFREFDDDQFDFHSYCLRKMTLRAYVATLRWEDTLRSHPYFTRAARAAIEEYLRVHRVKATPEFAAQVAEAEAAATAAKKLAAKEKKKHAKDAADDNKPPPPPADLDPLGAKFLATEPLEAAAKLVTLLETYAGHRLETHKLAFDVYAQQQQWLFALRAVQQMHAIAPEHPDTHQRTLTLQALVTEADAEEAQAIDESVRSVVVEGLAQLQNEGATELTPLADRNSAFLAVHGTASLAHAVAAARVSLVLGDRDVAAGAVRAWLAVVGVWRSTTFKAATAAAHSLTEGGAGDLADEVLEAARDAFLLD